MLTESDLAAGKVYLQARPAGRHGLLKYQAREHGSLVFLDLVSGELSYHPFLSWADLLREVSALEVPRLRRQIQGSG